MPPVHVASPSPTTQPPVAASTTSPPSGGAHEDQAPRRRRAAPKRKPADTAAAAIARLNASDPGQHICYRAYVTDIGWQHPVCDGAMAGTTGQSRAIESLNIAVYRVGGVGANGYDQNTGWEQELERRGRRTSDLYIGTRRQDAPHRRPSR